MRVRIACLLTLILICLSLGSLQAQQVSSVNLSTNSVVGGATTTATVNVFPTPTSSLTVLLSSTNTSVAVVPNSVVIAANSSSATFSVATYPTASTQTATINANVSSGTVQTAVLTTNAGPTQSFSATDDAYVQSGTNGSTNFGTNNSYLVIKKDASVSNDNRCAYIKLDL